MNMNSFLSILFAALCLVLMPLNMAEAGFNFFTISEDAEETAPNNPRTPPPQPDLERAQPKTEPAINVPSFRTDQVPKASETTIQRNIDEPPGRERAVSTERRIYNKDRSQQRTVVNINRRNANPIRVGVVLPLSGSYKTVGQDLLKAAELALFDIAQDSLELIVRDTTGSPEGAKEAVRDVIEEGAQIILGPLLSSEVKAVAPIVNSRNITTVGFTTDWTAAGDDIFVMGFMPFTQVKRVIDYTLESTGRRYFSAIIPNSPYGNAIQTAFENQVFTYQLPEIKMTQLEGGRADANLILRNFSEYDERRNQAIMSLPEELRGPYLSNNYTDEVIDPSAPPRRLIEPQRTERIVLKSPDEIAEAEELPELIVPPPSYDALILPFGGNTLYSIANLLAHYEVNSKDVLLLGTGLWDDSAVAQERALHGGIYAAPEPKARFDFEQRFKSVYGREPTRIATLGYDAVALTAVIAQQSLRQRRKPQFKKEQLMNRVGFAGVDGIFRFNNQNLIERGLAILQVTDKGVRVIDPAPRKFVQ